MIFAEICGYIASFLYVICYLPQIYNIYKKGTLYLSNYFMLLQFTASVLMSIYGVMEDLKPIYILNISSAALILLILIGIYKTHRNRSPNHLQPQPPPPLFELPPFDSPPFALPPFE